MGDLKALGNFIAGYVRGRARSSALVLGLTIVLASCGGSSGNTSTPPTPPSVTISASSTSIPAGTSTTLTVIASNATQVVLTDNAGDPAYTFPAATGGTDLVTPPANVVSVTYTAMATGASGATATNTVTVAVTAAVTPPTMTKFIANPAAILAGQSITLSWSSQYADYVVINASVGPSPGRVAANATNFALPAPTQTTTYSAVATTNAGQQSAPSTFVVSVNPITSFNGMDASQAEGGTTEDDIDPNGAVGDYQFLEYTNTSYQGYEKASPFATVWSAPQPMGTPWPTGTHCAGAQIQLDAVIIFDRIAKRWVMGAKTTVQGQGGFYFCIAVSNTDDLTSTNPPFAWNAYAFRLDPYLQNSTGTVTYLPDWPKLATWPEANNPAYYAAMDTVNTVNSAQTENGVLVCAFDRTDMLAGVAQSSLKPMMCYQVKGPDTGGYLGHSLIPADVDGTTPPPTGRDEFMVSIQNPPIDNVSVASTTINLWDFQLNWATPSFTLVGGAPAPIPVDLYQPGCYTAAFPAQTVCVPEQGIPSLGGLFVDSVGDRLMPRFAYRNFGTYESFLVSHTIQSPANGQAPQDARQTGIRWYELFDNGSGTPSLHQQGTITPDITNFRFLPSIAQDKMGNVAVGYSISSPVSYPGISMSFWNLNDPNGPSSTPTEITILDGSTEGEEVPYAFNAVPPGISSLGQWGSYALMTVDPGDDCTFWYVNEYWPTTNLLGTPANWATNISNFQIPGCQ